MSLQLPIDFDAAFLTVAPSRHPAARETSALAAVSNLPKKSRQNAEVLALITAAGDDGLSDHELHQMSGLSRQTICLRRFDMRSLLIPAARRAKSPSGREMVCWRRRRPEEMAS